MTGTTVNGAAFGQNPVINTVANNQKQAPKTQDFGDALNKAAQKTEQPKESYKETRQAAQPEEKAQDAPADAAETEKAQGTPDTGSSEKAAVEREEAQTDPAVGTNAADLDDEPVDEQVAGKIADVLQQILGQIKEILGVTDEELISGMENAGIQPFDLLDTANLTQFVAVLSGEGSAISLVADEGLYTALQDITKIVDAQADSLLEETGLTEEELGIVLDKLGKPVQVQEPENELPVLAQAAPEGTEPKTQAEGVPIEVASETAVADEGMPAAAAAAVDAKPVQEEPETEQKEDFQTAKMQKIPENQQDAAADGTVKLSSQETKEKGHEKSEPKDFGQHQDTPRDFQDNISRETDATGESVEKFTSENTESIMRQLADMVKVVKGENLTQMELQLHPASLGTVNVSLTTKGGMVTAEFTTQNEAVKAAIEAQASQLQANLEEQGVKIEAIEVSVESHQMERNLEQDNRQQQQAEEQRAQRVQGMRRRSINLKAFGNDGELAEELQGADDAARIAMEIMAANGNSMDLLA